ncbi:DUF429 domain-containing protein [Microbacterium sp. cx-59]|uniref:DUF429 domain-containing protein n=1 Tax=Microbacterium sp. cx-59 TaxID=2891207 RepID=UPI001E4DAF07|nr:DUF429 domain-containing protein [Microbacterium sp. cx-59]MCC4909229.1 DUF429 domain-containing protein [Microbacterium sp. cx-59]
MLTAGVDLAAQSKGTALAIIDWQSSATVVDLRLDVDDARVVDAARRVGKVGIDCAFGWPDEFVRFVHAHANDAADSRTVDGGIEWRRTLAFRETDRDVRRRTGRWPLSVSTDRLGLTAMRCAGLLARIAEAGIPVDRAGSGRVVEIYPGASLRLWGFATAGYRTDPEDRRRLLRTIQDAAPWLDVGDFEPAMISSADAFDAVIAALAARSAARGTSSAPPADVSALAAREGWIALPEGPIADLILDAEAD